MKYRHITEAAVGAIWAIQPEKLQAIMSFLAFAAAGGKYTPQEVAERIGPRAAVPAAAGSAPGAIAVIPVRGIISQRMQMMDDISGPGGTSTESLAKQFRAALSDETVNTILLDIDSPGGTVNGVEEVSAEIFKARGKKPIVSVVNSLAASAAYWIASAADEIVITPSGEAGSIGVYMAHSDISKALDAEGVKMTLIHAGEFKTEGNPYEKLSEEAVAHFQSQVNAYYDRFVSALAKHRGTTAAKVVRHYGKGRVFGANEALKAGMVDRIATLDESIARFSGRRTITRAG